MYLLGKCAYRDIQHIIESTQNKQQNGAKITCTDVRKKLWLLEYIFLMEVFTLSPPPFEMSGQ